MLKTVKKIICRSKCGEEHKVVEYSNDIKNEFTFIFMNDGWWLKVSTVEELKQYLLETESNWEGILDNLLNSKEFIRYGNEHDGEIATSIGFFGLNGIDATILFRERIISDQLNEIKNGNTIVINSVGGYFILNDKGLNGDTKKYSQWCKRKELKFPDFSKENLKIERFPLGNHWYIYLDGVQLRDKDKIKWNSYEEAYNYASKFIDNSD